MIKKCCICGNRGTKTILNLPFKSILGKPSSETWNPSIALCDKCGFIFQQNPFTDEELENRYKNISKFEFDSKDYIPSGDDDYSKRCLRQKHFIQENCKDFNSILEIGAASGYNLGLWSKEKTVYGVEPSEKNCALAKRLYDVDMYNGMFADFVKSEIATNKRYDLIFTSMTLEHIVNPSEFVAECARLSNRYFFIEVPTLDYKYVDEPYGMICEEHVNLFTLEGLTSLMNNAGFNLVNAEICFETGNHLPAAYPSMQTIWEKSINIDKKKNYMLSSSEVFENYIKANQKELHNIDNIISQIPDNEKLAVWGAGHHLSMLLANTSLQKKNIVRVYDSDLRKKGMLMGNVSIQPYDKSDIESGEVESILITTYVAQNPILRFLSKEKLIIPIYTLYNI